MQTGYALRECIGNKTLDCDIPIAQKAILT